MSIINQRNELNYFIMMYEAIEELKRDGWLVTFGDGYIRIRRDESKNEDFLAQDMKSLDDILDDLVGLY